MSVVTRIAKSLRMDTWQNLVTGVGRALGRTSFSFLRDARMDDQTLEDIFHGDSFGARVVDTIPEHALRQGFRLRLGDPGLETDVLERLEHLGASEKLSEAWTWGRLYGGGVVWVGADDGRDPAEPLDPRAIKSVHFLTVFDKRELQPESYYSDGLSPHYGEADVYRFTRAGGAGSARGLVHASRLLRFDGVVTSRRRRQEQQGWGSSELQRVYDKLVKFNGAYESVSVLLHDASQGVLKLRDLHELMAADLTDKVKERLALMDTARSSARSILLGDGEDFSRVEVSFTGIPDTLDRFLVLLAGASGIPVTILMGQAPAGLNATGDSDIRSFYDRVKGQQTRVLAPRLARLVRMLCLSRDVAGKLPERAAVIFPSLYQLTPGEEADLRNKQANTDATYIDKQVVTPEEIATSRFPAEGWSAETTIDLDVRQAAMDADAGALAAAGGGADPGQLAPGTPAPAAEHAEDIHAVVDRVGSRAIPRDAGIAQLTTLFGLTPEQADQVMGETGRTHFTAPEAGHAAELEAAQAQTKKLEASNRGLRNVVARVIERNKRGELVLGNLFAGPPTDTKPGDVLKEGDSVPAEAGATLDARAFARMDAADGLGVAVVLPLPPDVAARLALPGGEASTDLHITLAYLGPVTGLAPDALERARAVVAGWAATHQPITAVLAGQGRFLAPGTEPDPVYLVPNGGDMLTPSETLGMRLAIAGAPVRSSYAFTPHVTVAYVPKGATSPAPPAEPVPVTFGEVALWVGAERTCFPLAGQASDPLAGLDAAFEELLEGGA
jgi:phage-related protein (TIGR01555 family)